MNVKEVVATAKSWFVDTMADENVANVGLEEVKYDERTRSWLITLGFSRPWNSTRNALTTITGEPAARRVYRVITIRERDGQVLSMTRRNEAED